MKRQVLLAMSFISVTGLLESAELPAAKIARILSPYGKKVSASIRTIEGNEVVSINADVDFIPASVAKLVSTGCSMRQLTPQYQFETWLGIRGSIFGDKLNGDLVIEGSGDSSFVVENLKEMLERLRVLYGVKEIHGNLIFDASYFGVQSLQISDDFEGDELRAFNASLTAIPLNFNSFSIGVAALGDKTFVQTLPKDAVDFTVKNGVKVGKSVSIEIDQSKSDIIVARGEMQPGSEPKFFYRSLRDPYVSFAQVLGRIWGELGGVWSHPKFKVETAPVSYQKLFASRSASLSKVMMDINKLSTNMGAEMMALAAGADAYGRPASFEKSRKFLAQCWKELGLPASRFKLHNASGLSRDTRLQTRDLTAFLYALKGEFLWPEYLSSLSVLGRDGTTRKRLSKFAGQGRLKTGSIKGVKAIAGYLFPKKSSPVIVALFSDNLDPKVNWNEVEDRIIETVLEN